MSTLVFVEHHGAELQKGSLGVLAKAATLGDVSAVILIALRTYRLIFHPELIERRDPARPVE